MGFWHRWRAAAAASAQAVGGAQRARRSRAVEDDQARRTARKSRLYRGAVAGVSNSVLVRRGVVCEAASARRVGGNERARQRGRSLARAHRCRRKSHRRSEKSTVWCFTQTEQPPTHWTSVSLATFSTSTEDSVASLSLLCILLRIQERERPAPGGRTPSVSDFRPIRNCRFFLGSAHKVFSTGRNRVL